MATPPEAPAANPVDKNWLERVNAWVDDKSAKYPFLSTVTTLALATFALVGAVFLVTASGFNPYAIAAAAVIVITTTVYSVWFLTKACGLNDNLEAKIAGLRGTVVAL